MNMEVITDSMEASRKTHLFDECLVWVFDHCPDVEAYVLALKHIGFYKKEIMEELTYLDWYSKKEAKELIDYVWRKN